MPTNQSSQDRSSIFIISILAGTILGVVLLGLITALFITEQPASQYSFITPKQNDGKPVTELKSTPFTDHYVNYGGKTARIPLEYCDPIGHDFDSVYSLSVVDQRYIEINLEEHILPIENIDSIATNKRDRADKNGKIAYTVWDEDIWSAYLYGLETKQTTQLNIPQNATMFGAVGTQIHKFSEGGRYIYFHTVGPSSAGKDFVYDTKSQSIIPQLNNNLIYEILDLGTRDENIVIYYGGCENEDIITEGTVCGDGIYAINTNNGKTIRLDVIENHPNFISMTYPTDARLYYEEGMDVLHINTGFLAMDYDIKNFSKELKSLEDETITPKIEKYTDEKAYGTIKKLYQKNGTWYVDVDIAEFYPFGAREKPAMEDGVQLSDVDLVYIRDNSDEIVTFELAKNIQINLTQIIKDNKVIGVNESHLSNLEELEIAIQQGEFHFILEDGLITQIQEQYLP
jgi:hypothetical protein